MKTKLKSIENAIEVWSAQLSAYSDQIDVLNDLLTAKEKNRTINYLNPEDRNRFIISRGLLRKILAAYLDVPPESLLFKRNENGKPLLEETDLQFNLSHSQDHLLIAATCRQPVGVDIESHRDRINMNAITERWFSENERSFWKNSKTPNKTFFDIWSKKEAYVKACGSSIFQNLNSFTVPLTDQVGPEVAENGEWFFQPLSIAPDCAAAIVSKTPVRPVQLISVNSI